MRQKFLQSSPHVLADPNRARAEEFVRSGIRRWILTYFHDICQSNFEGPPNFIRVTATSPRTKPKSEIIKVFFSAPPRSNRPAFSHGLNNNQPYKNKVRPSRTPHSPTRQINRGAEGDIKSRYTRRFTRTSSARSGWVIAKVRVIRPRKSLTFRLEKFNCKHRVFARAAGDGPRKTFHTLNVGAVSKFRRSSDTFNRAVSPFLFFSSLTYCRSATRIFSIMH